jgi:hypothetical protein
MRLSHRPHFISLTCCLLSACGSAPMASHDLSGFTLQVAHEQTNELRGIALFTPDLSNSEIGAAFAFQTAPQGSEAEHSVAVYRFGEPGLAVGEYQVVLGRPGESPTAFRATIALDRLSADPLLCFAHDGTVDLREVTDNDASGELRLAGHCERASDPTVLIPFIATGTFRATEGLRGPGDARSGDSPAV